MLVVPQVASEPAVRYNMSLCATFSACRCMSVSKGWVRVGVLPGWLGAFCFAVRPKQMRQPHMCRVQDWDWLLPRFVGLCPVVQSEDVGCA